ncbi:hypothetical protein V1477_015180 [Vespula maculifrons]|uniref:Uncharacterized protein n=1 Tax=Vespula maculifrons TaxID=7453 RepID=A0ABD2BJJ6_VESMC
MIGLSNVLRRLVIRKVPCRYDTEFFVGIEAGIGAGAGAGAGIGAGAGAGSGVEAVAGTRTEFTRLRVTNQAECSDIHRARRRESRWVEDHTVRLIVRLRERLWKMCFLSSYPSIK